MSSGSGSPPTTPASPPTGGQAIPMPWPGSNTSAKYHWWYDSKSAGVANSPPTNMTGYSTSPTSNYSILSQSPPAGGEMNVNRERRDSLKNMYHLYDFATP